MKLESNLDLLARTDKDLASDISRAEVPSGALVEPARSGAPTLIVDGVSFHSRFDPKAEADSWARSPEVRTAESCGMRPAVFGLGLGYHVLALARNFSEVLVIEPVSGMIKLAFSCIDFREAMLRLRFVVARTSVADWPPTMLLPHQPSVRLNREEYGYWAGVLGAAGRAGTRGRASETVADLIEAWGEEPGWRGLLAGLENGEPVSPDRLAGLVRERRGPLTESEVYILLLQEMTRGDRVNSQEEQ